MGPGTPDGTYPWDLPPQGVPSADGSISTVTILLEVFLPTSGGSYEGGKAVDN